MKDNKVLTIVAILFAIGFSVFVLKELQAILIPFFVAIIIAFVFQPIYKWLVKRKVPPFAAIIIVIILIIIIANISSVFIYASINTFAAKFPVYEQKFNSLYNNFAATLNIPQEELKNITDSLKISNLMQQGSITGFLTSFFTGIVGVFGDFILILIYVIFMFSETASIKKRLMKAFTLERGKMFVATATDIVSDVRQYISGKTMIALLQGVVTGTILAIFGVDFYFLWGFLMFILHFIPNIGSLIATILPAVTMILQFDNIIAPILITILLVVVQNIIGNIIEPKVLGERLDLSPLLLLISLIFWGYVWGVVGMVLSVPIMSMIKIVLMNIPSTQPIAVMMSYSMASIKEVEEEGEENKKRGRLKRIFKRKK